MTSSKEKIHNKLAPYWAVAMFVFLITGLSAICLDLGAFWKGYVLDSVGPAWNYILFRGLFTSFVENKWTRFFSPKRTLFIFLLVSHGIETAQYFNIYISTFDAWDLLAYVSILVPLFLIDIYTGSYRYRRNFII